MVDVARHDAGPPVDVTCPHLAGLQANAPWPTMRRCPGRTASTAATGPHEKPTVVWSQQLLGGMGTGEPAIAADGTIYVPDQRRGLLALTPKGALKWATPLSGGPVNTPMLAIRKDGVVYALQRTLFAVGVDGTILWSVPLSACSAPGMEVGDDGTLHVLYARCGAGQQFALSSIAPNGMIQLVKDTLGPTLSMPALAPDGDLLTLGARGDGYDVITAITPGGGTGWTVLMAAIPTAGFYNQLAWPIVRDDGTVVFEDDALHSLGADGSALWTRTMAGRPLAAAPDGTVYVDQGSLAAIRADGTTAWQWGGATTGIGTAIVDGTGTVFASTANGIVAIAAGGTELWETSDASIPVAIDAQGTLYAVDFPSGTTLSALR